MTVYTDGSCSGNPGPGGWAAVLLFGSFEKVLSGGEEKTTNNRMELMGVLSALECLKEPCEVDVYTDSTYVVNAMEKGWARGWKARGWKRSNGHPALNPDLWERLLQLCSYHQVTFHWVKGHAQNPYNQRCDRLAVEETSKFLS